MGEIKSWFVGRLPDGWFIGPPDVTVDREEILVVGELEAPGGEGDEGSDPSSAAAEAGRIKRFREETRGQRMRIADEAEAKFGRKVAWGATCGRTTEVFTSLAVPVMTRLRQPQRRVLDTLVEAGVARSRSDALAWCVRLVGQNEAEWIERLRESLQAVRESRAAGPSA